MAAEVDKAAVRAHYEQLAEDAAALRAARDHADHQQAVRAAEEFLQRIRAAGTGECASIAHGGLL